MNMYQTKRFGPYFASFTKLNVCQRIFKLSCSKLLATQTFLCHVLPSNRIKGDCSINNCWKGILLDFSLTVKAATLIFISWCGSAIASAREGKSGFIYNLEKS